MCSSPREVTDRDCVSVGLHRGCDARNTSAGLFGSTLALHSIEFSAVRIVARALLWLRSRSESQPTVIRVQHVLPIRLNIHSDHVLLPGPKKEFQRYGKKRDHQHLSV